ncbi:MAG: hypothetical protein IJO72_06220 [Oscillospiraceae bacterium]|nr:hypothetical protein [Oscillospiraceae bacterium]
MDFIIVVLKILAMLASVFVMFLPLLLEYISFRNDCEEGLSHKRLRLMIFGLLYAAAITVAMVFLDELVAWIGSWSWVQWIAGKVSISARTTYCVELIAVMLINLAIGGLFKLLLPVVRLGLKKKDLSKPKKKNGEFSWTQKLERKVLKYFNKEKWFFAGIILKYLCLALAALYAIAFLFCLLPVFFGADWIPYAFAIRLFESGYIYPMITLIPLCQICFFLAGVENLEKECPGFEQEEEGGELGKTEPDIDMINGECQKLFKDHFAHEMREEIPEEEVAASTAYHAITKLIAQGISANSRKPKPIREGYLRCLNTIVENDLGPEDALAGSETRGVIVNGSLFTDFSEYFLRYCSVILSRGDNILFICNDSSQIEQTYQCVVKTLEQIYSLYHTEPSKQNINFDDSVWKVLKVDGENYQVEGADVNNCSVLITDLNFLTNACFDQQCDTFIQLVDTVVFVDVLGAVNHFARQMSVFDTKVKNIREQNATRAKNSGRSGKIRSGYGERNAFPVRYACNQIKYICFGDSRIPGLDKVLKNLLFVDFLSADAMRYSPQTVIACYNYEGRVNEDGQRERIQTARTEEDLGVLVNMADFAAELGAGKISLFAEHGMPFRDLMESIDANANHGLRIQNGRNLSVNNYQFDLDDCRVIVVFDHDDNLPMTIRRFRTMTSDKKTLVMVFSRPYMFRDYYQANIEKLWKSEQLLRIPVEKSGKYSAIQKILVKADSGGISVKEIFDIIEDAALEDYADVLENEDIRGLLRKLLVDCGKHETEALKWNDYFEFVQFSDFDRRGVFVVEERVCLRNKRAMASLLDGVSPAIAVIDDKEYPLPTPKNRITQNYIAGQNLLLNGCVYVINSIDVAKGKLFIKHATGGKNIVPYRYVQNREYHIDYSDPNPERTYPTKQVVINGDGEMAVKEVKISVTRRPMEVITRGYSVVDQRTLHDNDTATDSYVVLDAAEQLDKFKQTYRKYGDVQNPVCSSDMMMQSRVAHATAPNGAQVMSVKLSGDFGVEHSRVVLLAAVMLNEVLHTMFPTAADAVAVCPVLNTDSFQDAEAAEILKRLPKACCREYTAEDKDIEFLIIEDCASDLGVISELMSSGDDVIKLLFEPVYEYLQWYLTTGTPSDYLNFGMSEAPKCFDFEGLSKLATGLGKDEFSMKFVDIESPLAYDVCDFCGKRYPKGTDDVAVLEDGRKMCRDCAGSLVGNDKKVLKAHLERAKIFLESTYGITLGDDYEFCFESTVKIANTLKKNCSLMGRGSDVPLRSYVDDKKTVHVEYSIPSVNLSELLVRELTHVWQLKHLPELEEELAEGHIALVAVQYLRFLNQSALASVRASYYESNSGISGEGYRRLVRALLENPQYNNNPFRYLLEMSGAVIDDEITPPSPRIIEDSDYGLPYTPETPDRALDGNIRYFFYDRLTATCQRAYDILLAAIRSHEEDTVISGCSFADMEKVCDAVRFDHPELFWFKTISMGGENVHLFYGASAEEAELLQRRIDEVVPKYLEGIDDSMSAYDVALRLHVKVISAVDYDTIALNKQKQEGGPAMDKIDYLRTICGVFLEGKAVCEGYARAMQYLLQKCGVECAEVAGYIRKETGEQDGAHAWNILKLDGDYYYLDTTWDDSSNTVQTVKNNATGFDYFCITTDELCRTRDISLCPAAVPGCDATRGNYYYHNGLVLESYDPNRIKTIAQTAAKNHCKSFTFKCKTKAIFDQAMERICSVGDDCYSALKAAAKMDKKILTNTYAYMYDKNIWTITVVFKYK